MHYSKTLSKTYLSTLQQALSDQFKGANTIAIKIHFGEIGNGNAFKPKDIEPFTTLLKKMGKEYFLFDTSIAYPGPRGHPLTHKLFAQAKGWGKLGPITLSDDNIPTPGVHFTYDVAALLAQADGVLVISHVKGHPCTGFGGAIKNLGMGALSKQSKRLIHKQGRPKQAGECIACKKCEAACPLGSIKVTDKPHISTCIGCSNCGYVCPTGYLAPKTAPFDELLADGALCAQTRFKKEYYINIIKNISKNCDCNPFPGKKIAQDVGYLHGPDLIAIDEESYKLIIDQEGEDVFKKHNHKTGLEQVHAAKKLRKNKIYRRK